MLLKLLCALVPPSLSPSLHMTGAPRGAEKPLNNTYGFGRFVGEHTKPGDHHWIFSKSLVGSIVGWVLWDDSQDVFFLDRHHP